MIYRISVKLHFHQCDNNKQFYYNIQGVPTNPGRKSICLLKRDVANLVIQIENHILKRQEKNCTNVSRNKYHFRPQNFENFVKS